MATSSSASNVNYEVYGKYANYFNTGGNRLEPGTNGLTGFKTWECYMIVKYGNNGTFGQSGDYEYLLELPLYPDEVTEQISARWATQNVLGRSAPISAYVGTDLKSVSFSLDLHRDFLTGSFSHTRESLNAIGGTEQWNQLAGNQKQTAKGPFATRSWYTNANKMLQICCYPQYTSNGMIPPTTYFIFGQMILKGYVNSYSTTWKKPILNTFYGWNSVQINMDCYPDTIISAADIITNRKVGTASTQNTYNTPFPTTAASASDVMRRTETMERSNARSSGNALGGQVTYV